MNRPINQSTERFIEQPINDPGNTETFQQSIVNKISIKQKVY